MLFCPWQFVGGMLQTNSITILCRKSPTYNQFKFNVLSFLSKAFVIVPLVDQSRKCRSRNNIIIWSELNAQVWVSQVSWSRTLATVQTATLQLFWRFFSEFWDAVSSYHPLIRWELQILGESPNSVICHANSTGIKSVRVWYSSKVRVEVMSYF